jgi:hypothetical protein
MKKYSTIQAWPVCLLASGPIPIVSTGLRLVVMKQQVTDEYSGLEAESLVLVTDHEMEVSDQIRTPIEFVPTEGTHRIYCRAGSIDESHRRFIGRQRIKFLSWSGVEPRSSSR